MSAAVTIDAYGCRMYLSCIVESTKDAVCHGHLERDAPRLSSHSEAINTLQTLQHERDVGLHDAVVDRLKVISAELDRLDAVLLRDAFVRK